MDEIKRFNGSIYLILIGLALIAAYTYAIERTVFIDNALHIYNTCTTNKIGIMAGRWPIAIVRLPLWISVKLNINICYLPYIYSLSHMALILSIGGLVLKFKTNAFPIFIITYLGVLGHTFFWCVSEIIPAILLSCLFIKRNNTQVKFVMFEYLKTIPLWLLVVILILFSHPQGVIPLIFVSVYSFICFKNKKAIFQFVGISFIFLLKSFLFSNWYDVMKMGVLKESLINSPFGFVKSKTLLQLLEWRLDYLIPFLLFTFCITILLRRTKYLHIAFYTLSILAVGYLFIQSNPNGVSRFYAESNFYLLTFMSGVVIYYENLKPKHLKIILASILLICVIKVMLLSNHYSKRYDYIVSLVQNQKYEKALIPKSNLDMDLLMLDWGLPFETIITSQLIGSKLKTAVSLSEEKHYKNKLNDTNVFLNGIGGSYPIDKHNSYFILSNSNYQLDSILTK